MRKTIAAVALLALSGAGVVGFAAGRSTAAGGPKSYFAVLNTGQQIPLQAGDPVPTGAGIGVAHFLLKSDRTICANMTVTGLSSPINAAHIHTCRAGVNGNPIIYFTPETDGVWRDDCGYDNNQGQIRLTKGQVDLLNTRRLYVNVHTTTFGDGELRGQIFK